MSTLVAPNHQVGSVIELSGFDAGDEGRPLRGREPQGELAGILGIADPDALGLEGDLYADLLAAVGKTGFPEIAVGEPDRGFGVHGHLLPW